MKETSFTDEELVELISDGIPLSVISSDYGFSFDELLKQVRNLQKKDKNLRVRFFSPQHLANCLKHYRTAHGVSIAYRLTYYEVVRELRETKLDKYQDFFRNKLDPVLLKKLFYYGFSDAVIAKAFEVEARTVKLERHKWKILSSDAKNNIQKNLREQYVNILRFRKMTILELAGVTKIQPALISRIRGEVLKSASPEERQTITSRSGSPLSDVERGFLRRAYQLGEFLPKKQEK